MSDCRLWSWETERAGWACRRWTTRACACRAGRRQPRYPGGLRSQPRNPVTASAPSRIGQHSSSSCSTQARAWGSSVGGSTHARPLARPQWPGCASPSADSSSRSTAFGETSSTRARASRPRRSLAGGSREQIFCCRPRTLSADRPLAAWPAGPGPR